VRPAPGTSGAARRAARSAAAALLCAALLLPAQGCVTTHSFRPDTFDVTAQEDIRVYLKERRMLEFEGGAYRSIDSAGIRYLVGNGLDNRPDSALVKVPFSGYLPFYAIDRIETRKTDYISAIYVIGFIGFFAVLGFGTNLNK
jgi:hypothetical protein